MVESIRRIFLGSWLFWPGEDYFCSPQSYPPCQGLVGNLLWEKGQDRTLSVLSHTHLELFPGGHKEQYYSMGSYENKYIQWTTLRQQRDQDVHELTNQFHTLCTNLGIKYLEKNLVLNYCSCLHRYIQEEMEFLDISSLGTTYQYATKIEHKFKHKRDFGSTNQKKGKGAPKL